MGEGELVQLRVYDLSQGLARQLSPMLLGRQIEAIYHTSIVVGGVEHFYGGGIQESIPGHTPYGQPIQILDLGRTHLPADVRQEYLVDISDRYSPENYHLFNHNCNNFSDEFATFLTGQGIPPHITSLPAEVLSTPFGQAIAPMLGGIEARLNTPVAQQHAITRSHPQPEELLDMAPGPAPTAAAPSPAAASAAAVAGAATPATANAAIKSPAATTSSPAAARATGPAEGSPMAAVSSPAAACVADTASAEAASAAVSSPPASAPELADTDTPSAAATPELPPAPHKGAAANSPSRRAASVSPCVTEAAAGLSLASPGDQVVPRKVSRTSGGSTGSQPKRPLRFDASDQDEQAQQAQHSSQAPSAAAGAAAAAHATASTSGAAPHPISSASAPADLQAAFQAALTQEFMRIRAMHPTVSPNEAAALALKMLREKSPGVVAARG